MLCKKVQIYGFLLVISLILTFVALLPPIFFGKIGDGLDPSWQIALQLAWDSGRVFGREFVFTYGPLGFLSCRLPFESIRSLVWLSDLWLLGLTAVLLFGLWRRGISFYTAAMLLLSALLAGVAIYFQDLAIYLSLLMICFAHLAMERSNRLAFLTAALLSIEIFYLKLNMGLVAGLVVIGAGLVGAEVAGRYSFRLAAENLGIYLVLSALAALLLPVDFLAYLKGSLEIASGFNETMVLWHEEWRLALYLALTSAALLALALLLFSRQILKDRVLLATSLFVCGFLFVVFKQSFTRADGHVLTFFRIAPITITLFASISKRWLGLVLHCVALVVIGCSIFIQWKTFSFNTIVSRLEGVPKYLSQAATPVTARKELREEAKLPAGVVAAIGGASVDFIPWDVAYAYYYPFDYAPRPVMQSYSAYTEYLDRLNAGFYRGESRPDRILYAPLCVDKRQCFWDETETKLAILENYDTAGIFGNNLVLTRRETPRAVTKTAGPELDFPLRAWTAVPKGQNYAKCTVRYSLLGKLSSFFFQTPDLFVIAQVKGSKNQRFKTARPLLAGGVLLGNLVTSVQDAEKFFSGKLGDLQKIERFKIVSPQRWGFSESVRCEWENVEVVGN